MKGSIIHELIINQQRYQPLLTSPGPFPFPASKAKPMSRCCSDGPCGAATPGFSSHCMGTVLGSIAWSASQGARVHGKVRGVAQMVPGNWVIMWVCRNAICTIPQENHHR